jgi:serine/threonine-protein kinase RsbW
MSNPGQRGVSVSPALHLHLDCTFAAVRSGATQIRSHLQSCGLPEKDIWACELAFVEGCNNAVQYTPDACVSKKIIVELLVHSAKIELRINDHTRGCDFPVASSLPPAESENGRGIFLMRTLMDDVAYIRSNSSNCLVLKKTLTGI